jgi:SHS2 domain-containing protein
MLALRKRPRGSAVSLTATHGYRQSPHTADAAIEAWGPNRASCLEEAVLGVVSIFTRTRHPESKRRIPLELDADTDEELLVAVLEDVIYLLDVDRIVPVAARFEERPDGSIGGVLDVVPVDEVEEVGAMPKGISRSDLRFREHGGTWRCHVVVDV